MADQESSVSQPPSFPTISGHSSDTPIPAALKFLISNIKHIVPHPLSADNYPIWRFQLLHHFTANGFAGFLSGDISHPADSATEEYHKWCLIDRNLTSASFPPYHRPYFHTSYPPPLPTTSGPFLNVRCNRQIALKLYNSRTNSTTFN
ncbi:hypothetical protein KFK09_017528 [Dendrobium nobile]|uniref:Retrotransposon Copia-like N-terminal domain-containing protein n=1 Tax=Dendrobium nobile TaxID=94219 RepID=A0A8T3B2R3_DENNO|nr:hypothetical protein KFK09_017528 [Dendrobium nobile]